MTLKTFRIILLVALLIPSFSYGEEEGSSPVQTESLIERERLLEIYKRLQSDNRQTQTRLALTPSSLLIFAKFILSLDNNRYSSLISIEHLQGKSIWDCYYRPVGLQNESLTKNFKLQFEHSPENGIFTNKIANKEIPYLPKDFSTLLNLRTEEIEYSDRPPIWGSISRRRMGFYSQ